MNSIQRSCPVCTEKGHLEKFRPARAPGTVVACVNCGMQYVANIDQPQSLIFEGPIAPASHQMLVNGDRLADLMGCWELSLLNDKKLERPAWQRNARAALNRLERVAKPPGRLLDFGSGWGFFLETARRSGWDPYGLEPLAGHAAYARASVPANIVCDTLHADTFLPGFFDVITAFQVFEHLPYPARDLAWLVAALRPGGVVLVEAPEIDTWSVRLFGARHRHFVPDHINYFSAETLRRLMQQAGLEILDMYHPIRYLSLRYIASVWGRRFLPTGWGDRLASALGWMGGLIVPLTLGDIVAVVGRKP